MLAQKIGTPESRKDHPSGGERRRINIAHELLRDPRILLLDEPTTGLSSTDTDMVMAFLHLLACDQNKTIVMTAHQPSDRTFDYFDDLLLVSYGGVPAYYGDARKAVAYFQQTTGIRYSDDWAPDDDVAFLVPQQRTKGEYLLDFVRTSEKAQIPVKNFEQSLREPEEFPFLKRPLPD